MPKPFQPRGGKQPEHVIQEDIIELLERRGWFVKPTIGSAAQQGFPDLYATHANYGPRWIEVKRPDRTGNVFTAAQLEDFPKFSKHGAGVWVLTGATEPEYRKLFQPANWWSFLTPWKAK